MQLIFRIARDEQLDLLHITLLVDIAHIIQVPEMLSARIFFFNKLFVWQNSSVPVK